MDAIDCSTGGIPGASAGKAWSSGTATSCGFAGRVRQEVGVATIGVGLMWDPRLVEQSLEQGEVDLVALARELLDDPNWTLRAARELGVDDDHRLWHPEFGWWLEKRAGAVRKLGLR